MDTTECAAARAAVDSKGHIPARCGPCERTADISTEQSRGRSASIDCRRACSGVQGRENVFKHVFCAGVSVTETQQPPAYDGGGVNTKEIATGPNVLDDISDDLYVIKSLCYSSEKMLKGQFVDRTEMSREALSCSIDLLRVAQERLQDLIEYVEGSLPKELVERDADR